MAELGRFCNKDNSESSKDLPQEIVTSAGSENSRKVLMEAEEVVRLLFPPRTYNNAFLEWVKVLVQVRNETLQPC